MKISPHHPRWKGILVFCLLASLAWHGFLVSPVAPPPALLALAAAPPDPNSPTATVVTVSKPVLTPLYSSDVCASGWYRYTNIFNNNAFLSLNVELASDSHNSAEWRPDLSDAGKWEVEVFIPKHGQISWPECPPDPAKTISRDTSHATYTIHHADGQTTVALDQYPLSDVWVTLGRYPFAIGSTGYVTLSDVTGEGKGTTTVSYSAMRFTYKPYEVHLPLMRDYFPGVLLDSTWTAAAGGHPERSFYPSEPIRLSSRGRNTNPTSATAAFTWSVSGSCPANTPYASTHTELVSVPSGDWTHAYTATTPTCTGFFTYTLQLNYNSRIFTGDMLYVVSDPGAGTILSVEPAFDRCQYPSIPQLQAWWDASPYNVVNLYIGGVHRGCNNIGLDVAWLRSASQMGWTFIPTWVGLQAPCESYFSHQISTNATIAYGQGRSEAKAAADAASAIGLPKDTVIYYDLEAYAGSSVTTACRNAVKSFMNGWVERLHELGKKAGAYGSPRGSYMADWSEIAHVPDYVWIAVWYSPYFYDPEATVWVPEHLSDDLWAYHQRIRQYTNSHTETWGGVALTIDSNILDGGVAALPQQLSAGAASPQGWIQDARLISQTEGWSLVNGSLRWTTEAGRAWQDITPPGADGSIQAAYFLDERQGWALTSTPGGIALLRTSSAGEAWQSLPPLSLGQEIPSQVVSMQFIDPQNGWIVLRIPSNSNFSLGSLLRTADGGQTWEQLPLPLGEPARFVDAQRGWIAGGPAGNELYTTRDGGRTWEPVWFQVEAFPGLPVFTDPKTGLLPVTYTGPDGSRLAVYRSTDGGETWELADTLGLDTQSVSGITPLAALAGAGQWVVALPDAARLYALASGGALTALAPANLPGGTVDLQISPSAAGWARTLNGTCQGEKPARDQASPSLEDPFRCKLRSQLWLTTDGGITWTEITP